MTAPDPDVFRFLNEIGIIEQLARNRVERKLPHDLKLSQFTVLNHLVRLGGDWSPSRLASAFQVTRGAMTNTVKRLESQGFVEVRAEQNDGRSKLVRITAAGEQAQRDCLQAIAPDMKRLQEAFSARQFAAAVPFLEQVRSYLDNHRG